MNADLSLDLEVARRFLEVLDPEAEQFTFQTFDDNEELKRRHLARIVHGSLEDAAGLLISLQQDGAGTFVTINETDGRGRTEANMRRVRAVFADLDGAPLAPVLACALEPHVVVESSPGRFHAYWLVEGLALDQFKGVQQAIIARFKSCRSCCDTTRVLRLPGFIHQKGEPFRTRIVEVSTMRLPYSAEEILAEFPPVNEIGNGHAGPNGHDVDPDRETSKLIRRILTGEEYHCALRDLAYRHARDGMTRTKIVQTLEAIMDASLGPRDARWAHRRGQIPMLAKTAIDKLDSWLNAPAMLAERLGSTSQTGDVEGAYVGPPGDETEMSVTADISTPAKGDAALDFSHDGLALAMGMRWARHARHVALWGKWMLWNGNIWSADEKLIHLTWTRDYLRYRADELVRAAQEGKLGDYSVEQAERFAKTLRSAAMVANVSGLVRSNAEMAASVEQWDTDPWLLGTPAGTVDLRTGELREAQLDDFITKTTAVAPAAPGTPAPIWARFLHRITGGDQELIDYLGRYLGYCLTGSIREHAFAFGHGEGANGKGVLLNTVAKIMADYALTVPTEMLMVSQSDRHPTELARLRGVRLAIGSETEEGKQWAEAKIKSLTGGDPVAARFMRQDFFELMPQFKIFVVGNRKPSLRGVDEAIRRRLHFVPFLVTIPPAERDPDLPEKLTAEWPAILRWMIDGCMQWQVSGLNPPEAVRDATSDYLAGEDAFERWRSDRCDADINAWTPFGALWSSWKEWAFGAGEFVGTAKAFGQTLQKHGFKPWQSGKDKGYRGISLRARTVVSSTL
jgi:putative DNA primase/helicase